MTTCGYRVTGALTALLTPDSYLSRNRGPEQWHCLLYIASFIFSASRPAWAAIHYRTLGILQRAQGPAPQQSAALTASKRKRLFCSLEKGKEIKFLGNQEQSHVCVIKTSHITVSPKRFHLAKPKGEALSQRFLLFGTYYQFKSA